MNDETKAAIARITTHRKKDRDTKVWQAQILAGLDGAELFEAAVALLGEVMNDHGGREGANDSPRGRPCGVAPVAPVG